MFFSLDLPFNEWHQCISGFYEEQVRYPFRIIGQAREDAYVWDGGRQDTEEIVNWVG